MATIHLHQTTTSMPGQFLAGLTKAIEARNCQPGQVQS